MPWPVPSTVGNALHLQWTVRNGLYLHWRVGNAFSTLRSKVRLGRSFPSKEADWRGGPFPLRFAQADKASLPLSPTKWGEGTLADWDGRSD